MVFKLGASIHFISFLAQLPYFVIPLIPVIPPMATARPRSNEFNNMRKKCLMAIELSSTYIQGHAGIWYNDTADHLAGAAEPIGSIQLYPSDVRNRLWVHTREKPPSRRTWWFFSRMDNAGIKFGHGANQHTKGSSTRISQQVLGVIPPAALKDRAD